MSTIDDRIVRMQFDNTGFESGAVKAIELLDKLGNSLKLDDASEGLDNLSKNVKNFNLNSVENALESCTTHFSSFEAFSFGVFSRLGAKATDFALDLGSKLKNSLTKSAKDGFGEYQLQINSIQTISANSGEDMSVIKQNLEELNEYADKTTYVFSDMTAAIGRFTSAGIGVEPATKAIQGFANASALAGAGPQEMSRGIYQLSQAMSAGVVQLQDWKSIETASIDTEQFRNVIIETARAMGKPVDDAIKNAGSFRASLKDGWLTADVMQASLENLTMSTRDFADEEKGMEERLKQLTEKGYSEDVAKKIIEVANAADDSAREIRTWEQLVGTIGEAMGSGWAKSWEYILGDIDQATELFTTLGKKFDSIIGASSKARNALLSDWQKAGGRDALVGIVFNLIEAVSRIVEPISDAWNAVFGITGEQLSVFTENIARFTESLVIGGDEMSVINTIAFDFFETLHSGLGIIMNLVRWVIPHISGIGSLLSSFVQPLIDTLDGVASFFNRLHQFTDALVSDEEKVADTPLLNLSDSMRAGINFADQLRDTFSKLVEWMGKLIPSIRRIGNSFYKFFAKAFSGSFGLVSGIIATVFSDFIAVLPKVFKIVESAVLYVSRVVRTFATIVRPVAKLINFVIKSAVQAFYVLYNPLNDLRSKVFDFMATVFDIAARMLKPIRRSIREIYDIVKSFFIAIKELVLESSWFQTIVGLFDRGKQIVMDFIGSISNPFEKLKHTIAYYFIHPLKEAKDALVAFGGDDRVKFFKDFFKDVGDIVRTQFSNAFGKAREVFDWLVGMAQGPVGDALSKIQEWFGGLNLKNPFENIAQINLSGLFGEDVSKTFSSVVDAIQDKFSDLSSKAKDSTEKIKDFFTEISKKRKIKGFGITTVLNNVKSTFGKLSNYFKKLKKSGKSYPQIIATVLGDIWRKLKSWVRKIGDVIGEVYRSLRTWMSNYSTIGDGFLNKVVGFFDGALSKVEGIPDFIQSLFGGAEEAADKATSNFGSKLETSSKSAQKTTEKSINGIFDRLPSMDSIREKLSEFFNKIRTEFLSGLSNLFSGGNGESTTAKAAVGGLFDFSGIEIKFPDFKTPVENFLKDFTEVLDLIPQEKIDTIVGWLTTTFTNLGKLWTLTNFNKWLKSLTAFNNGLADGGEGVGKFFSDLPEAIKNGMTGLGKAFSEGLGGAFTKGIDSLSKGLTAMSKAFDPLGKKSKSKAFLNVSTGILMLAGALWVLASIPADSLQNAAQMLVALGGVTAGASLLIGFITKLSGADLQSVGAALLGFGAGMLLMTGALFLFSRITQDRQFALAQHNFQLLIECVTIAVGALELLNVNGGMGGTAATILALTASLVLLIVPLTIVGLIPQPIFDQGFKNIQDLMSWISICIAALMLASEKASNLFGAAAAMLALAAAVTLMTIPVLILGALPSRIVIRGSNAVDNLSVLIAGLISLLSLASGNAPGILAGSVAMIALSVAVSAMAVPVIVLGLLPLTAIEQGLGVVENLSILIAGVVGILGFIAFNTLAIIGAAAGMIAMDIAVAGLALVVAGLSAIAKMNPDGLKTAMDVVVEIVMSIATLAIIGGLASGGLIALAGGILLFSAALGVLALAIGALRLAVGDWSFSEAFNDIGNAFTNFGQWASEGLLNGIQNIDVLGSIRQFFVNAANAVLEGFGSTLRISSPSKVMEEQGEFTIEGLIDGIKNKLYEVLGISEESGETLLDGLAGLPEKMGTKASEALQSFIDNIDVEQISQKGSEIISGLIAGIGQNMVNGLKQAASDTFHSFVDPILEFFGIKSPSTYMQNEVGTNILQGLINGLSDGSLLGTLGGVASTIGNAITTGIGNIADWLGEKASGAMDTFTNTFGSYTGDVSSEAASISDAAVSGVGSIEKPLGAAATGGAMSFIRSIAGKAGEFKSKGKSIETNTVAGTSALKSKLKAKSTDGMNGFISGITGKIGGVKAAVSRVMSAASSSAKSLYNKFHTVGSDAVRGLVDGINSLIGKAEAAAAKLSKIVIKASKKKLDSDSPSKVFMQIGRDVGNGLIIGMGQSEKGAAQAGSDLAKAIPDAFSDSLTALSLNIEDLLNTDYTPVITPVINTAQFDSGLWQLTNMLNTRMPSMFNVDYVNYNQEMASKFTDYADSNKQALEAINSNRLDYNLLGVAVANALIQSGVHVEMDGGQLMGYLAGEISDARRMYG